MLLVPQRGLPFPLKLIAHGLLPLYLDPRYSGSWRIISSLLLPDPVQSLVVSKEYRARIDGEDRDSPNMGMKSLTMDHKWGGVFGDYFIHGKTTNEAEIEKWWLGQQRIIMQVPITIPYRLCSKEYNTTHYNSISHTINHKSLTKQNIVNGMVGLRLIRIAPYSYWAQTSLSSCRFPSASTHHPS